MSGRNQSMRRRPCSLGWLLLLFVAAAGVYPIAIFHYYLASGPGDAPSESLPHGNGTARGGGGNAGGNRRTTDAIVYLAQFGHHSSYGAQHDAKTGKSITGLSKLNQSLALLYANYVDEFPADVMIFHEPMFAPDNATREMLGRHRPGVQFRSLDGDNWRLPFGLKSWEHTTWKNPAFSIGYRLMMRWYAVLIWDYLQSEGYTHCMRLDDDSYIRSKIKYNLFDYMRDNDKRYGFVQPVYEGGGDEFDAVVDKYLAAHPNVTSRRLIKLYTVDRGVAFYNNFFVADVSFFNSPPASEMLRAIDESKLMFTHRTGDLVIQSAVVRLLLPPNEIQWFRDITYEHMTLCRREKCGPLVRTGCPQNGGVSRGAGVFTDAEWYRFATEEVKGRFADNPHQCSLPISQHFVGAEDVRTCMRRQSRCDYYLRRLSGANGVVDDPNWLQNVLVA